MEEGAVQEEATAGQESRGRCSTQPRSSQSAETSISFFLSSPKILLLTTQSRTHTRVHTHVHTHIHTHLAQHTLVLEECGEGHYERLRESPWKVSFLKPAPVRVDGTQEAPSFKEMHRTLGTAEGTERQAWRQQVGGGWRTV